MKIKFVLLLCFASLCSCGSVPTSLGESVREIIDYTEDQRAQSDAKEVFASVPDEPEAN
jgi:hypothetical protein